MHRVATLKFMFIIFHAILFKNVESQLPHKMIVDLFVKQRIKTCYFFGVSTKQEKIQLGSAFYKNNIRFGFLPSLEEVITAEKNVFIQANKETLLNLTDVLQKSTRNTKLFLLVNSLPTPDVLPHSEVLFNVVFILKKHEKYEFLNLRLNGTKRIFMNVGVWRNGRLNMQRKLFSKQKELTAVQLRAYTRYSSKFLLDLRVTPQELLDKFHFALFLLLHELHNFTYVVKRARLRTVPDDDVNTTMRLLSNQFEILTTGTLQTPSKVDKIDFLMPFFKFKTCFFFRRPRKSTVSFKQPFLTNTWIATAVLSIIITILLKVALVTSKAEDTSWNFSAMTVFSTLCQDGDDPSPDSHDLGCKLLFLSLLIMSLLLFNYYTSSMVSLLLTPEVDTDHTVDELTRSHFDAGVDTSYVKTWLETVNFSNTKKLYKKKLTTGGNQTMNLYSPKDGIVKVRHGKFAYHTDDNTAYYFIGTTFDQEEICSLSRVKMIPPSMAGLAIQKDSFLFEMFQTSLLKMNQNGIINKLVMTWKVSHPECRDGTEFIPIGNDQSLPAIILLGAGMLAALIILGVEFAWVAIKKR